MSKGYIRKHKKSSWIMDLMFGLVMDLSLWCPADVLIITPTVTIALCSNYC